jgi:predicted CXXCH cytochrome family protein
MLFGHKGHLVRVAGLFLVGIAIFLAMQAVLVPKGFGVYGHYRAGALDDNRARPLVHAGRASCVECHGDVPEAAKGGRHQGIRCEACHGALARHAGDPASQKAVKPDSRVLCVRCHESNLARPARFPQIDPEDHAGTEACTECHSAHNPGLEKGATP